MKSGSLSLNHVLRYWQVAVMFSPRIMTKVCYICKIMMFLVYFHGNESCTKEIKYATTTSIFNFSNPVFSLLLRFCPAD